MKKTQTKKSQTKTSHTQITWSRKSGLFYYLLLLWCSGFSLFSPFGISVLRLEKYQDWRFHFYIGNERASLLKVWQRFVQNGSFILVFSLTSRYSSEGFEYFLFDLIICYFLYQGSRGQNHFLWLWSCITDCDSNQCNLEWKVAWPVFEFLRLSMSR